MHNLLYELTIHAYIYLYYCCAVNFFPAERRTIIPITAVYNVSFTNSGITVLGIFSLRSTSGYNIGVDLSFF